MSWYKDKALCSALMSVGVIIALSAVVVIGRANLGSPNVVTSLDSNTSTYVRKDACEVYNVVDGDTFDANVDIGYDLKIDIRVRSSLINSPEMNTQEGKEAKKHVDRLLVGEDLFFHYSGKKDSFGRYIGEVYGPFGRFSDYMIKNGYAKEYKK